MDIKDDKSYSVTEIARAGWIVNTDGRSTPYYVKALIRAGRLPAIDISLGGKKPHWRVKGHAIKEYLERY